MAVNNIRSVVVNAAHVPLMAPVIVKGQSNYTLGSNVLSWGGTRNYTLADIAPTFGQVVDRGRMTVRCGSDELCAFDFGLLYASFTAMVTAYAAYGAGIPTEFAETSAQGVNVTWFGNEAIVYSLRGNFILPIKSADVQNAYRNNIIKLENFVELASYQMKREGMRLVIEREDMTVLCHIEAPNSFRRAFPQFFVDDPADDDEIVDDPKTFWDERSQLGSLITSSVAMTDARLTAQKYATRSVLDSVVTRSDLICEPKTRYASTDGFLGSLCYTDRKEIALAVNFRENLFVYSPWFNGAIEDIIELEANPQFSEFYNVTEECKRITLFAQSVVATPLTAAQFDLDVFERVKTAFYNMELPRIPFASTFGKVVIPEPTLVNALSTSAGESVYCLVPVGSIGARVVCKTAEGALSTIVCGEQSGVLWGLNSAFYDITEVVS